MQAAIDSITDASESNPYEVNVNGVFVEDITHKPYVYLTGDLAANATIVGRHTLSTDITFAEGMLQIAKRN